MSLFDRFTEAVNNVTYRIHGRDIDYIVGSNPAGVRIPLKAIKIEGVGEEGESPGKYQRFEVRADDLPAVPKRNDTVILADASIYAVVRVDASQFGVFLLTIQKV